MMSPPVFLMGHKTIYRMGRIKKRVSMHAGLFILYILPIL